MCNFYNISYTGRSTVVTHTLGASTLVPRDSHRLYSGAWARKVLDVFCQMAFHRAV